MGFCKFISIYVFLIEIRVETRLEVKMQEIVTIRVGIFMSLPLVKVPTSLFLLAKKKFPIKDIPRM